MNLLIFACHEDTSNPDTVQLPDTQHLPTLPEILIHQINGQKQCLIFQVIGVRNLHQPINHFGPHLQRDFMPGQNVPIGILLR
jgi:hypothetical protein